MALKPLLALPLYPACAVAGLLAELAAIAERSAGLICAELNDMMMVVVLASEGKPANVNYQGAGNCKVEVAMMPLPEAPTVKGGQRFHKVVKDSDDPRLNMKESYIQILPALWTRSQPFQLA